MKADHAEVSLCCSWLFFVVVEVTGEIKHCSDEMANHFLDEESLPQEDKSRYDQPQNRGRLCDL